MVTVTQGCGRTTFIFSCISCSWSLGCAVAGLGAPSQHGRGLAVSPPRPWRLGCASGPLWLLDRMDLKHTPRGEGVCTAPFPAPGLGALSTLSSATVNRGRALLFSGSQRSVLQTQVLYVTSLLFLMLILQIWGISP